MASYNRVIIAGNLTRDPEYKQLPSGQAVCKLSLAVNRQYKNRQTGDLIQEVCYIDVEVWGAQAESCRQYLQKGRSVLVEGRLKLDTWQDNEGQNRSRHAIVADRIVFLSGPQQDDAVEAPAPAQTVPSLESLQKAVRAASMDAQMPNRAPKKRAEEGTVNLPEEPAFQDDLPF